MSVWSDIEKRSMGKQVRKEDQVEKENLENLWNFAAVDDNNLWESTVDDNDLWKRYEMIKKCNEIDRTLNKLKERLNSFK